MDVPEKGPLPLARYCNPRSVPQVPPLLIKCIHELEKPERLRREGLYNPPSTTENTARISYLDQLLRKTVIRNLSSFDVQVICGVVRDFFRAGLTDSIVPAMHQDAFRYAVESEDVELLKAEVDRLPQVNKDTLAYMMLHFKEVVASSMFNGVTLSRLDDAFGVSILCFRTLYHLEANFWSGKLVEGIHSRVMSSTPQRVSSAVSSTLGAKAERTSV